MAIDYVKYGSLVIENFEGGYFHPDMYKANPSFFNKNGTVDNAYARSGETMFGFDRVAGGNLNKTSTMVEFWNIIDKYYSAHHSDLAWWNEMAGKFRTGKPSGIPSDVQKRLRELAVQTMKNQMEKLSKQFLTDKAKEIVFSEPRLFVQFFYGCWNGSGRFQKYSQVVNDAVKKGITDAKQLNDLVQEKRIAIYGKSNPVAVKVGTLTNTLPIMSKSMSKSKTWLWITLGIVVIGGGVGLYLYKRRKAK
jgi:hypothetical protein